MYHEQWVWWDRCSGVALAGQRPVVVHRRGGRIRASGDLAGYWRDQAVSSPDPTHTLIGNGPARAPGRERVLSPQRVRDRGRRWPVSGHAPDSWVDVHVGRVLDIASSPAPAALRSSADHAHATQPSTVGQIMRKAVRTAREPARQAAHPASRSRCSTRTSPL
jgi:hypothetical protein